MRCPGILALALGLVVATAEPALAELTAPAHPGRHRVEHEVWVDLGRFVECDTWVYVLKEGDTLGEVAERELGTTRRLREMRALNPGVDPRRMRPGQSLTMPPRRMGCDRAVPRFVFFAWTPDQRGWSAPRRLDAGKEHRLGHDARLFAVPVGFLSEVCEASGNRPLCAEVLAKHPHVSRSGAIRLHWSLPDADPAQRIVTRMRVAAVQDGVIRFEGLGEARYDADGLALAPLVSPDAPPSTPLRVLLFLLLVAGAGWGVHAGLRRNAGIEDAGDVEAGMDAASYEDGESAADDVSEDGSSDEV